MSETHLEKMFEKLDIKLDNISKDLSEFKNGISITMSNFSNRLENTENKVKNIENSLNKPLKERFLDMIINGLTYSFSACLGLSVFLFVLKSVGGDVGNVLKYVFSAFV